MKRWFATSTEKRGLTRRLWMMTPVLAIAAAISMFPSDAMAQQNIAGVANTVFGQLEAVGKLIVGGAFIIGVGLIAAGLLKLKAAAETQGQQVKWGDGIWRIAVGVGLVSLLHVTGVGAATFGFTANDNLSGSEIQLGPDGGNTGGGGGGGGGGAWT